MKQYLISSKDFVGVKASVLNRCRTLLPGFVVLCFAVALNGFLISSAQAQSQQTLTIDSPTCGAITLDYCESEFGNAFGFADTSCDGVPAALESPFVGTGSGCGAGGGSNIVLTLPSGITTSSLQFALGGIDSLQNETVSFDATDTGGVLTASTTSSCLTVGANNLISPIGNGSGGLIDVSSTIPFNTLSITSTGPYNTMSVNSGSIVCPNEPEETALDVVKTASVDPVTSGVAFDYVITVTDSDDTPDIDAENVVVSDTLDSPLTCNSVTASGSGVASACGATVTCTWATIVDNTSETCTINVTP